MARPGVDLLDPHFHVGDPHPSYRWMREHEPAYHDARNGLWAVTRMEDLRSVERRPAVFVSSRGYRSIHTAAELSMISKDDPAHAEQRRLIADRFTPRAVGLREPGIRAASSRHRPRSLEGYSPAMGLLLPGGSRR